MTAMLVPTLVMFVLAAILLLVAWKQGDGKHLEGVKSAGRITLETLPLLVCAFLVAGLAQVLLPKEWVAGWVGTESGMRGIFLGAIAGGLAPGGPYVSMPIAAGLLKAGAGIGTMVAFLTGWSVWAVSRMPLEVGIMGWKFTAIRIACSLVFPPLAGIIAHLIFGRVSLA